MEENLFNDVEILEQEAIQNQSFDELERILFESGNPANVSSGNPGDEFDNVGELAASWTEASIPFLSRFENDIFDVDVFDVNVFDEDVFDQVFGVDPVMPEATSDCQESR